MEFNKQQKEAIEHINGPLLLLAGAGAGKTRVITHRIANMIQNHNISPSEILAVTFTVKAAKEMKERVEKLINKRIEIATFHSFALKLLKEYSEELGYEKNFTIYDILDQMNIINLILRKKNYELKEGTYDIVSFISKFKEKNCKEEDFSDIKKFREIFKEYNNILKENNAMDFSDILVNLNKLLFDKEILKNIQERFKYIMIDEYQDTNKIQYDIINKIANKYKNLCVVGDENQSIYKFRGADIKNILNFKKDYPKAKVIKLEINYRSTKNIVNASNSMILHNKERIEKNIKSNSEIGSKIKYNCYSSEYEEAEKVVKQIMKNIEKGDYDNAILYRVNKQSRLLEEQLSAKKIKYIVKDGGKFHDRKEIKNLLHVMYFINNNNDFYNAFKAINMPRRIIGMSTMQLIREFALKHNITLLEAMQSINLISNINNNHKKYIEEFANYIKNFQSFNSISELIEDICQKSNYYEYLKLESIDFMDKIENIEEFKKSASEFEKDLNLNIKEMLNEFLEHIENMSTQDINEMNAVKLMTIHSSKGLEFNNVFIIGFEDGQIPMTINENEKNIEEERRLFYVALTRAKKRVYLSRSKERLVNNKIIIVKESRFFKEIPSKYIENYNEQNKKMNVKALTTNYFENDNKKTKLKVGNKVFHENYGEGIVENTKNKIRVIFHNANINFDKEIAERELKII